MLTSIDVTFIFTSARLSASLGDRGLFNAANILQILDVVLRVVFLLFLLFLRYFWPIVYLFRADQTREMFRYFCSYYQNDSTSSQVFSVNDSIIYDFAAILTSSVQYGKCLPNLVDSSWL